jgi:putative phosphoribosyl transferase
MFADREEAGRRLAPMLDHLKNENPVVIGLPRGGLPVAKEVARRLEAPLDVFVVAKIGAPGHEELAIGAVGPQKETFFNQDTLEVYGGPKKAIQRQIDRAHNKVKTRLRHLGVPDQGPDVEDRVVIIVDDGVATGSTAMAALRILHQRRPQRLILAVPVIPPGSIPRMRAIVDELVYVEAPEPFMAVGAWYDRFDQVSDEDVRRILDAERKNTTTATTTTPTFTTTHSTSPRPPSIETKKAPKKQEEKTISRLEIPADGFRLQANLHVPENPRGVVLFAHGTGSGRKSPRNQEVARIMNQNGFATLLMDLLTPREQAMDETRETHAPSAQFSMLADRLAAAAAWVAEQDITKDLDVAAIGSSTGAAVALLAAARHPELLQAVVSRGGRIDLVGQALGKIKAPTLLIVGGADHSVMRLNEDGQGALECENELHLVPGATHLFSEPGTLREAAEKAADWFRTHLRAPRARLIGE